MAKNVDLMTMTWDLLFQYSGICWHFHGSFAQLVVEMLPPAGHNRDFVKEATAVENDDIYRELWKIL